MNAIKQRANHSRLLSLGNDLIAYCMLLLLSAIVLTGTVNRGFADEARPYEKVVTIGGSLTEIVYALGEQDRLAGRDSTSVYPKAVFGVPDVGYIRQLSPEGVLSVNPDLILALEGAGPPETIDTLKEAGLSIITVPERYTADNIIEKIKTVGEALGVSQKAEALAEETQERLDLALGENGQDGSERKVLFVLSLRSGKVLAAGNNTAANSMIGLAGAENAITGFDGYKQVSDEAVITAQPDVVLMMNSRGNHSGSDTEILTHPAIVSTPAGKNGRLVRMDGLFLLGFGPRTADAIGELKSSFDKLGR
jgi:iron complex transport system substrate-binding protein